MVPRPALLLAAGAVAGGLADTERRRRRCSRSLLRAHARIVELEQDLAQAGEGAERVAQALSVVVVYAGAAESQAAAGDPVTESLAVLQRCAGEAAAELQLLAGLTAGAGTTS